MDGMVSTGRLAVIPARGGSGAARDVGGWPPGGYRPKLLAYDELTQMTGQDSVFRH